MKIKIAAFSHRGVLLALSLAKKLNIDKADTAFFNKADFSGYSLKEWANDAFCTADSIIFIGAVQIAVRIISPLIKSKLTDPAVIVLDDCGNFCIPILSGHLGGANILAQSIAKQIGAAAVITTSTDINHVFAIDSWCVKNNLKIENPKKIKDISSALLNGEEISICSEFELLGELPPKISQKNNADCNVVISCKAYENEASLHIVPPIITVGCGCKKLTDSSKFKNSYYLFLKENNISPLAVKNLASVDIKANEPAVVSLAKELEIPFLTFSKNALENACGVFSHSQFVLNTVGVDNVCERSAVLASGGNLIVKKTIYDGITFAAAINPIELIF